MFDFVLKIFFIYYTNIDTTIIKRLLSDAGLQVENAFEWEPTKLKSNITVAVE